MAYDLPLRSREHPVMVEPYEEGLLMSILRTADEVRELRDLGVDRTLAGSPLRALEGDDLSHFRDEIMTRV